MEKPTHYVLNSFSPETIFRFFSHEITMEWMKLPVYGQKNREIHDTKTWKNVPLEVRING